MRAHHSPHQYEELIPGLAAGAGVAQMEAGSSPAEGWSSPKSVGVKGIRKRGLLLHSLCISPSHSWGAKKALKLQEGFLLFGGNQKLKGGRTKVKGAKLKL